MKCKISGLEIKPFMSFGKMPIANGFLEQNQFDEEYFSSTSDLAKDFIKKLFVKNTR